MAAKRKKGSSGKTFRFQLSLGGIIGIAIVSFCLFLWMFLLGVWAGQTILLPSARPAVSDRADQDKGQEKPFVSRNNTRKAATAEKK
ncbi:MAG TPA: hypothetical protein DDY20_07385 [Desulfobulbaceae bacterium]|nr:hypothetical protein [Desulfobulbaceae bacterium]